MRRDAGSVKPGCGWLPDPPVIEGTPRSRRDTNVQAARDLADRSAGAHRPGRS